MDMTPQAYPLHAWTPDGDEVAVIGWTTPPGPDPTTAESLVPVVVSLAERGKPHALDEPLGYFAPEPAGTRA